jgi:hypothetical protein
MPEDTAQLIHDLSFLFLPPSALYLERSKCELENQLGNEAARWGNRKEIEYVSILAS